MALRSGMMRRVSLGAVLLVNGAALGALSAVALAAPQMLSEASIQEGPEPGARLEALGGSLYFGADDGTNGLELWSSDGTPAGTHIVKNIKERAKSSNPARFRALGKTVYFRANDGTHGAELWKTDGTDAGTELLRDIMPGSRGSYVFGLTAVGSRLFFIARDPELNFELWVTDGTTRGTRLVKDINVGAGGAFDAVNPIDEMTAFRDEVYFEAFDDRRTAIWASDGTERGTEPVKVLKRLSTSSLSELTVFRHVLYFGMRPARWSAKKRRAVEGDAQLWSSDGTRTGTRLLKDVGKGSGLSPRGFRVAGRFMYFWANGRDRHNELWRTDGTREGTLRVKAFDPADDFCGIQSAAVAGDLYLTAQDGNRVALWKTSPNGRALKVVKQLDYLRRFFYGCPASLVAHQDGLYFTAWDEAHGYEIWKSDGSARGTAVAADLAPGAESADVSYLTSFRGALYFTGRLGEESQRLWRLAE